MNILDFAMGNVNRLGGAIGRVLQPTATMGGMPAAEPSGGMSGNRVMERPEFSNALARLGLNLMAAGEQGGGFLGNLGQAGGATIKDLEESAKTQQAIAESQFKMQPSSPFSGDGFDNQAASAQYQYYVSQGMSDIEARQRAVNDILSTKTDYQMVRDANGNVSMVGVPRKTLPSAVQPAAVTPNAVRATSDASMPTDADLVQSGGGMVLPPKVDGKADASLFNAPPMTPNAQNAFNEARARELAARSMNGGQPVMSATEAQANTRASMLKQALDGIEKLMFNPNIDAGRMAAAKTAGEMAPNAAGPFVQNKIMTPEEQMFDSNMSGAVESLATSITGAAFSEEQKKNFISMLPNGTESPEIRREKLINAYQTARNIATGAGAGGTELRDMFDEKIRELKASKPVNTPKGFESMTNEQMRKHFGL